MTLKEAESAMGLDLKKPLGVTTAGNIRAHSEPTSTLSGCVRIDGKGKESVYACGSVEHAPPPGMNTKTDAMRSLLLPYDKKEASTECIEMPVPIPGRVSLHVCGPSKDAIHDSVFKLGKEMAPTGVEQFNLDRIQHTMWQTGRDANRLLEGINNNLRDVAREVDLTKDVT